MRAYRNSQLAMLRLCGHAYAEAYVRGNPGQPSPSLQAGQHVHAAVKEAVRRVVAGKPIDVYEIAYREARGGQAEYADTLQVLIRFQEALGTEFDIDPKAVFMVEERLEISVRLSSGEEVAYYGTPDLVERVGKTTCRITDWKTHWHPESEEEFLADPQLPRYALLIAEHFPAFQQFELVKRFVRWRGAAHRRVLTRDDLEQVRLRLVAEIEAAREREEAGAFEATGGAWCSVCSHHATCPIIRRYREDGVDDFSIPDDEAAARIAGDAIALDAAASRMKDRVKRYLAGGHMTGRVSVAGGEYGYGPVEHREVSAEDVARIFLEAGAELPLEVFRVDLGALDRLARKLPDSIVRRLESATRRWQSSECRFRRTPQKNETPPAAASTPQGDDLL